MGHGSKRETRAQEVLDSISEPLLDELCGILMMRQASDKGVNGLSAAEQAVFVERLNWAVDVVLDAERRNGQPNTEEQFALWLKEAATTALDQRAAQRFDQIAQYINAHHEGIPVYKHAHHMLGITWRGDMEYTQGQKERVFYMIGCAIEKLVQEEFKADRLTTEEDLPQKLIGMINKAQRSRDYSPPGEGRLIQ